jgi:GABA permease/S-methylmethionine transporter
MIEQIKYRSTNDDREMKNGVAASKHKVLKCAYDECKLRDNNVQYLLQFIYFIIAYAYLIFNEQEIGYVALILFIVFGSLVLTGAIHLDSYKAVNPFQSFDSAFPFGIKGIFAAMIMVMFSFTGTGIIGLAIADTENPEKNAPPAISMISISVIILYCVSLLFVLLLTPWNSLPADQSPFISIFGRMNIPFFNSIFNFIILTAALSGLNSSMYSSSRMMSSLSADRQAPVIFQRKNKKGVPVFSLILNSGMLILTVILSYFLPEKVFILLATASGFLAMFNWLTISATHFFYRRKALKEKPEKVKYKVPGYPYISVIEAALILVIFCTAPLYEGQAAGLITSLVFYIGLVVFYIILKKLKILR